MELSSIQHIDPSKLTDFEADIFVTVLCPESHCTHVARSLETKTLRRIALVRSDPKKGLSFQDNQSYFIHHGFEIVTVDSGWSGAGTLFGSQGSERLRVILDSTCMPPKWSYVIFNWFGESQKEYSQAIFRVVYMLSELSDTEQVLKLKSVKSFLKKEEDNSYKKKTALILGLGHEKRVSESIYNKIKPDLVYLFYADPAAVKKHVEKVFVNNHALINSTPIRNLIAYPIRDGQIIYQSLIDTILPLRNEYSIVLVPNGPKFFALISMLIHLGYPDTQIKYPRFKKSPLMERIPIDEPVVLDVLLEEEE